MGNRSVIGKKHLMLTALFAIYMSEYMICLVCMDKSAYDLAGTGKVLHYLKMPAFAAGMLLFPVSQRLCSSIRARRILVLVSNILFILGMDSLMGMFGRPSLVFYSISCAVTLLSLGLLGGAVYYYYAMGFVDHPYLGRLSGLGGAVAFLIQMSVQTFIVADIVMVVLLLIGFVFTTYLTLGSKERFEWMFDEPLEYADKGDPSLPITHVIIIGIAGMMLLYMICGLTDTIIVTMNYAGDMGMYAWPRLFGAAGYLLGGYLADIGRRKWLMISALCLAMLCIPLPFMLSDGSTVVATCLYYIIAVGQIQFLNVFFWDLAPRTEHPRLVSGLGRVLPAVCVVILPALSGISVTAALMIEVTVAAAVVLCIVFGGYYPITVSVSDRSLAKQTDPLGDFAQRHGLTPRETDFLKVLLESDDDVQIIASNMNVSTRTVYRHINNIYEKTGTETRYALMRYYYQDK